MEKTKQLLFKALSSKYQAEIDDSLARLSVYSTNAAGIGEHPQITEEMDKLVEQFVNASDKLSALDNILTKMG